MRIGSVIRRPRRALNTINSQSGKIEELTKLLSEAYEYIRYHSSHGMEDWLEQVKNIVEDDKINQSLEKENEFSKIKTRYRYNWGPGDREKSEEEFETWWNEPNNRQRQEFEKKWGKEEIKEYKTMKKSELKSIIKEIITEEDEEFENPLTKEVRKALENAGFKIHFSTESKISFTSKKGEEGHLRVYESGTFAH